jgi:hypothetical protein
MQLVEDDMMFEIMKKGCAHRRADVVTVQQPQKNDKRADKVNAKRRQPTFIQDRTYGGAMCTEKIHYFCRYVRVRAYAKKGKFVSWGWGDTAP